MSDSQLHSASGNLAGGEPAMTPTQRSFTTGQSLSSYRRISVGGGSWIEFAALELYNLVISPLPSIVGLGLRRLLLPFLLGHAAGPPVVGCGVGLRVPRRIRLGRGVVLDDFSLVDVRADENSPAEVGIDIGDRVFIGRFSAICSKFGKIRLGNGCNIGSFSRVATESSIEIGESVLISTYCYIGGGNHLAENLDRPIIEQGMDIRGGVKIGANSWIGTKATIVDGVTVGRDAIVGAHSLVLQDVPDRAIVAGTPAKIIRMRE
jgi:acetyltransferase-like isoleucine patch superfamily enzyme